MSTCFHEVTCRSFLWLLSLISRQSCVHGAPYDWQQSGHRRLVWIPVPQIHCQVRGTFFLFQLGFSGGLHRTNFKVQKLHNWKHARFVSVTATKCLWTSSTWQHSWCRATGCPSWTPTCTPSCTRRSAATARTAAARSPTEALLHC